VLPCQRGLVLVTPIHIRPAFRNDQLRERYESGRGFAPTDRRHLVLHAHQILAREKKPGTLQSIATLYTVITETAPVRRRGLFHDTGADYVITSVDFGVFSLLGGAMTELLVNIGRRAERLYSRSFTGSSSEQIVPNVRVGAKNNTQFRTTRSVTQSVRSPQFDRSRCTFASRRMALVRLCAIS